MQPTDCWPLTPFQAHVLFAANATPRSARDIQADAGYCESVSRTRREALTQLVELGYLSAHPVTASNGVGTWYAITCVGEELANTLYDLLPSDEVAA